MKAVILAAGEGRRLRPLTAVRPKPMVPIANRPLLERVVTAVADAGIDEIVLVVGYKRERIQNYFGDGDDWDVDIEYAIQDKQLGTGHAVLQAAAHIEDDFLVLNGDRIIEPTAIRDVREHDDEDTVVMSVTRSQEPSRYGVVELDGNRVTRITEKPPEHTTTSDLINAGVYRFDTDIFAAIQETTTGDDGELAITATLNDLADAELVCAQRYQGLWQDVTHLWDVISVNASVLDRADRDTRVETTARIDPTATVTDAVAMDRDAAVQPNATVLRGTAIGENVRIGPNSVVANSLVLADATIEAGAVVRDAIVGENVRIGANTTIAGGVGDVVVDGELYPEVRLGGVVGDNTDLGGAVTVVAGTVIGTGVTVEAGATLDGRIPNDAEVRRG
ncbi:MAG: bifunctional sugar-1-phosphate nucleotidylyltransferase/acetyltransferase [Halobacteriales archaeon]